ncbi:50S ribosomal protein L10 [Patescibacteria group bacterium]|nr:50S ribosomal protein L10 [Patescibacteria group bacterium]
MALTKEKKIEIVGKLKDIFKKSPSVVFVNFHGLSVADTGAMRSTFREQGVGYFVTKKTLIHRVLLDSGVKGNLPVLDGELALVYLSGSDDNIAPARGVYEFVQKHKNNITILGGIFDGKYIDHVEMTSIATIPSLEVLYGQFVNIINSPIAGLVIALNGIAEAKN